MAENGAATRRRWDDKGTGHVSSVFVESLNGIACWWCPRRTAPPCWSRESSRGHGLPEAAGDLIVWSEAESMDLALSFQEKDGCDEIWGKICSVQGKDPSVEITQDVVDEDNPEEGDDTESETRSLVLPPCELSWLGDLVKVVTSRPLCCPLLASVSAWSDRCSGRATCGVSAQICREEADDRKSLGQLHEVIRNIFYLNNKSVFEVMFADDVILDVIGILEVRPGQAGQGQSLGSFCSIGRVIAKSCQIQKADLRSKIHQTFRVQVHPDCILPTPACSDEHTTILNDINNFDDKDS
uniref:SMK-1 domain-containing protein n=1 Tax=Macrostomum lignano TaxID=282301 RepID=A0A1I8FCE8_9PLAT